MPNHRYFGSKWMPEYGYSTKKTICECDDGTDKQFILITQVRCRLPAGKDKVK